MRRPAPEPREQAGALRRTSPDVVDGPFDGDLVAGYWLWGVPGMDDAVTWVKRCPNPMPLPSEIEIRLIG